MKNDASLALKQVWKTTEEVRLRTQVNIPEAHVQQVFRGRALSSGESFDQPKKYPLLSDLVPRAFSSLRPTTFSSPPPCCFCYTTPFLPFYSLRSCWLITAVFFLVLYLNSMLFVTEKGITRIEKGNNFKCESPHKHTSLGKGVNNIKRMTWMTKSVEPFETAPLAFTRQFDPLSLPLYLSSPLLKYLKRGWEMCGL